ncbi:MAG: hypothetical protein AB1489_29105, partial [Acidobacteriota bacterium]
LGFIANSILNIIQPERELKTLQEGVELSDTVENRIALANFYIRNNQPEKAVEIYQSCLNGVFKKDPDITLELIKAQNRAKKYDDALITVKKIKADHPNYEQYRRELIYAEILENMSQDLDAKSIYEAIIERHGGEEAHCKYGRLLEKIGEKERAKSIYEDTIKRTKRLSYHQKKLQREWIKIANDGLVRLSKPK